MLGIAVTFHLVSLLWLLFQLPDIRHAAAYVRCLFTNPGGLLPQYFFVIVLFGVPVALHHLWGATHAWRGRWGPLWAGRMDVAVHAVLLFLVIANAGTPGDFIYFQF
jgi:hypothetical protein